MAVSASVHTITSGWSLVAKAGDGVVDMPNVLWQNQGPGSVMMAFNPDGPDEPDSTGAYLLKSGETFHDVTGSASVYCRGIGIRKKTLVATTL